MSSFRSSMLSEAEVSQIAALRNTNTYPSQEREHLCEVLRSSRKHSLMLAETISQLEAKLPALAKEKEAVDVLISDLSVILHPARTIPHEILSEIFTIVTLGVAAPTNEHLCGRIFLDSLDPSSPSWVLSKVSSNWRRAALSTSALWTTIALDVYDGLNSISSFFLFNTFLERSGGRKLSVHLASSLGHTKLQAHPIIPTLLTTCPRWEHLAVSVLYESFNVFKLCPAPFTNLASLFLASRDQTPPDEVGRYTDLFVNAPALRAFAVTEPSLLHSFGIPETIHHYSHTPLTGTGAPITDQDLQMRLLSCLPSLKYASLVAPDHTPYPSGSMYLLPDLQSLSLLGTEGGIQDLCEHLRVPAVKHLVITHAHDELFSVAWPYVVMESVTELDVRIGSEDRYEAEALEITLKDMPMVSDLTIRFVRDEVKDASEVFNVLNPKLTPGVLVGLKTLTMKGADIAVSGSFLEMIQSRRSDMEGIATLERVSITLDGENQSKVSFDELHRDGFQDTYLDMLIQ